jgi:Methane oxygenase PmoA
MVGSSLFAVDFSLKETPGQHMDILQDGKTIGRYMTAHDLTSKETHDETYKPYLHLFDAEGKAPITKGSGGEYTHHRGLFIGWMKISVNGKTVDRWHMKGGEVAQGTVKVADIVHQKFTAQKAGAEGASITSLNHWQGPEEGKTMIEEERTMTFLPAPKPAYAMINFESKLKAVLGDTKLEGDPEHAGLQFRPSNEVDRTKTTYIYPKAKAEPHKDRDYPWVGETYSLNGKTYSVVYLNHPENPKDTPISAYRNYGRFGMFFKSEIKKDATLDLKVRVIVIEGEMPSAQWIQEQSNAFTGKSDPTPEVTIAPAEQAKAAPKKNTTAEKPAAAK